MTSRRRALTLVEVLVALAIGAVLFVLILGMHTRGLRVLESDARKMTAIEHTHRLSERLRQEFFQARFAWVVPLKDLESGQIRDVWATAPDWIISGSAGSDTAAGPTDDRGSGLKTGSPLLYVGFTPTAGLGEILEVLYDAPDRQLFIGGRAEKGAFSQVLFFNEGANIVKYLAQVDEHSAATMLPAARERSTVVGAVYLPLMDDEVHFGRFVHEPVHGWCLQGSPIQ